MGLQLYAVVGPDGSVEDVQQFDEDSPVAPSRKDATNVACPDFVRPGWSFRGGKWVSPEGVEATSERVAEATSYMVTKGVFFRRLTRAEWGAIYEARKMLPDVAYLWDNLLALDEGIECPPDGLTDGRAASRQALEALTAVLGDRARAEQLFEKP